MDFQEFNELFNEIDEFAPNFDLGLENWDNWENWETDWSVIIDVHEADPHNHDLRIRTSSLTSSRLIPLRHHHMTE